MAETIKLEDIYYNPHHPAAYSGFSTLYRYVKPHYTQKQVKEWLKAQEAYSLHKPARRRFPRNRIIVSDIDEQWELDLVDMRSFAGHNDDIKYILTCIDVLSKYAWAICLKGKTGSILRQALQQLLEESHPRHPRQIRVDKGGEFVNSHVKNFLKEQNIRFFTSQNETKAAIVERFNRTLKNIMWRYFTHRQTYRYVDKLDDFLQAYNHRYHRSIKMKPVEVTPYNAPEVWRTLYGKMKKSTINYKYEVGESVRISKNKSIFEKGYWPNWTREIFTIAQRLKRQPPVYRLKDSQNQLLTGTFYEYELQSVTPPTYYQIEAILDTRGRGQRKEYLIKWTGYPSENNSWVNHRQLKDLT